MPGNVSDASTSQAAQEALERFVVDNEELRTLEALLGAFNIFDALGIASREIQHSNFLAWLLDPAESHGLGSLFLTPVLMDILRRVPSRQRAINAVELDSIQLQGVEVRREWRHIDILIAASEPQFVVAIENKVYSSEHSDQLARYRQTIDQEYRHVPAQRRLFVYLSPGGLSATDDAWITYSYADLHGVLARVRTTHQGAVGDDVLAFLDHYLRLLRSRLMETDDIRKLCEMIYKKHRQAVDLIFEYAPSPDGSLLERIGLEVRGDPRWHVWNRRDRYYLYFAPKNWLSEFPRSATASRSNSRMALFLFRGARRQTPPFAASGPIRRSGVAG